MVAVAIAATVLGGAASAQAVAAPDVDVGVVFAPGSPAPPVLDQQYGLALPVTNDGDVALASMTLIATLPIEQVVSSVTTGVYTGLTDFAAGEGVRVSYQKNTAPGVFTLWGSSPNTTTNTTLTSPPPGLGAGEYLTQVRWELGAASPGMRATTAARLNGRATNPDNAGGPTGPTDQVQTCASVTGQTSPPGATPSDTACFNFNLVTGPAVTIDAPDSTPLGSPTAASATLSGGAPTGMLTFSAYAAGDALCATPLLTGAVTVNGAGIYTGPGFPATAAGAYKWVARYGGDGVHAAAATACNNPAGAFAVVAPPGVAASFAPATITAGGSAALSFTVSNPDANTVAQTGVAVAATLPAGLAVASPNGVTGTCGGTITAVPGSQSVTLSGGAVPVDGSCTVTVGVTASAAGALPVTATVGSANGGGGDSATATLTVEKIDPALSIASPASTPLGGGLAATASLSGGDPTGTITFSAYAAADGACATPLITAGVPVDDAGQATGPEFTAASAGAYRWTASYGGDDLHEAQSTACGDPGGAFAVVAPPSVAGAFAPAAITAGRTSRLTFTIANPPANTVALTGVALAVTLPAGLAVASPNGLAANCGGTTTAASGSRSVALAGAGVPVGGRCSVAVDVVAPQPGTLTATSGAVSSANGGDGDAATAELVVAARPPAPPPPPPAPPGPPGPPAEPAISQLELRSRCVRPSRSGRVRVRLRMRLAEPSALRIRVQRGVGSKALRTCPEPTAGPPFTGPFKTVETRDASAPQVMAAAVERSVRLRLALRPGLYRVTVRAVLADGSVSSAQRVFLRVLKRKAARRD